MRTPITVEAAILFSLSFGTSFGLEIIERVKTKTKGAVNLGTGSVYPALQSLQKGGLVEVTKTSSSPTRGGRPRQYYKLTAAGKKIAASQNIVLKSLCV